MVVSESMRAIANDSGAALRIYGSKGEIYFSSEAYAAISLMPHSVKTGASLYDEMPRQAADERVRAFNEVREHGQPVRLVEFIHGRLCVSTYRRLEADAGNDAVLAALLPVEGRAHYEKVMTDPKHRRAEFNTGGPLSGLGIRQIEVLRLIGMGLNGQEIAQALHRSPRTIEFHRKAIRDRLGDMSLIDLAHLACRSGIVYMPQADLERWWSSDSRPVDAAAGRIHDAIPPESQRWPDAV